MLDAVRAAGAQGNLGIPASRPAPDQLEKLIYAALRSNKGNGYAGQLIELCDVAELPATLTGFLRAVYARNPKPHRPPVLAPIAAAPAAAANPAAPAAPAA